MLLFLSSLRCHPTTHITGAALQQRNEVLTLYRAAWNASISSLVKGQSL